MSATQQIAKLYLTRAEVLGLMQSGYKAVSYSRRIRVGARLYKPYAVGAGRENVHTNTLQSLLREGLIRPDVQTKDETIFVIVDRK